MCQPFHFYVPSCNAGGCLLLYPSLPFFAIRKFNWIKELHQESASNGQINEYLAKVSIKVFLPLKCTNTVCEVFRNRLKDFETSNAVVHSGELPLIRDQFDLQRRFPIFCDGRFACYISLEKKYTHRPASEIVEFPTSISLKTKRLPLCVDASNERLIEARLPRLFSFFHRSLPL